MLGFFALGVNVYIVSPILPQMAQDLQRSVAEVGLLVSAYSLPYALLGPLFGPMSDRLGRKLAIVTGMGIFTAANLACAAAPGFAWLALGRGAAGIGAAIFTPAVYAYVGDRFAYAERARAMSVILAAVPAATILGLPLGGLAAGWFGWRGAFAFIGTVALAALAALRFVPRDTPQAQQATGYLGALHTLFANPAPLSALMVTFTWFMASSGIFTYLGDFFAKTFAMRTEEIALVLGAYGLMGIVGTRLGGRFSDTLGKKRSVMLGITAFGLAALSLQAASRSLPLALAVLGVWAIGIWFGLPSQQAILSELAPALRGTVMAVNNSVLYLGSAVGPAVAGQIYIAGSFSALSLYTGVVAGIALGLAALVLVE